MDDPEGADATVPRLVVGAALVRDARVLAAYRRGARATGWEFPGGKVEPGETPDEALVREVREELGCTVEVTGWLPGRVRVRVGLELAVATVRLVEGEPMASEHESLRWCGPDDLAALDWLPADRPFLAGLGALLDPPPDCRSDRQG